MGIERHQFIANLPSEACTIFTPGLAWLLAGLRTCRRDRSTWSDFLLAHLPGFGENQWYWAFDPAYRCGAVPVSHRIPFNVPLERHQQTNHKIEGWTFRVNQNVAVS
jgi:hypothetical protein